MYIEYIHFRVVFEIYYFIYMYHNIRKIVRLPLLVDPYVSKTLVRPWVFIFEMFSIFRKDFIYSTNKNSNLKGPFS